MMMYDDFLVFQEALPYEYSSDRYNTPQYD